MSSGICQKDWDKLSEQYREFYREVETKVPNNRIFADPIRCLAYGTDASLYRINPKLVIKVRSTDEIAAILQAADRRKIPVTFRAAGTSLSGQALTDSVLLVLAGGWNGYHIAPDGMSITLEPGIIGSEANEYLKPYSRKIGPDPASIRHAMVGGIAANNASGMCCGTADNSYKTVESMKIIFADGTLLDTGNTASRQAFASSRGQLLKTVTDIRDEIQTDPGLKNQIIQKYKIKNTTGYSLNAFVDFTDPFAILSHLLIGSEGTLGFISEITYRTILDHTYKASSLMIFPDIKTACLAVMKLDKPLVAAAELIDRVSLRSVEDRPGMPEYLKSLAESAAALLVETRAETAAALKNNIAAVEQRLTEIPSLLPITFTDVKAEYEKLWNIRAGVFPAVGGIRPVGTSVIIEDVAFPRDQLADAVEALRLIMNQNNYEDGIIYGHALDGNVHFVFNQDFSSAQERNRYQKLINDVCDMVVHRFHGSLKAEHGTGRNMAPFVEMEWGKKAYGLMQRLKTAFDPNRILNPEVILTENSLLYVENLKAMPATDDVVDKCIECGYCEVLCPSKNLTATPRQRIVVQREINRLTATGEDEERLTRLKQDYEYFGEKTCAADGLCEINCPLSINTGTHTKKLRSCQTTKKQRKAAKFVRKHFAGVTTFAKLGLAGVHLAHRIIGSCAMGDISQGIRKLSGDRIPKWNPWLPRGGATPEQTPSSRKSRQKIVYFPSCLSRTMGPALNDRDQRQLSEVMLSLLAKANFEVIFPPDMNKLCCGMPFESKGFFEHADKLSGELEKVLLTCTQDGKYPVLCDTSPCVYRMKKVMAKRLKILDTVEFIHDYLLEVLEFTKLPEPIAIHVTCSATKMGLAGKFRTIGELCAAKVIIPDKVHCCGFAGDKGFEVPELNDSALEHLKEALPNDCTWGFSNSRTCEIGLADHSGISYQSIAYLVDYCSTAKQR